MSEWQPIETAPKGTWVLVSWVGGQPTEDWSNEYACWDDEYCDRFAAQPSMVAVFIDGSWRAVSFDLGIYGEIADPTHWMPLPEPPESDK